MPFAPNGVRFGGLAVNCPEPVDGIPVTLTPGSPLAAILKAIAPLTRAVPVPMTDVAVAQPYTAADGMSITGLRIS